MAAEYLCSRVVIFIFAVWICDISLFFTLAKTTSMSIRIGIYDFFGYTIPGALMLLIFSGFLDASEIQDIWAKFYELTTFQIVLSVISCYLAGYVFNPFLAK